MRGSRLSWIGRGCALLLACGGGAAAPGPAGSTTRSPHPVGLDGLRFVWMQAECSDGPLDLARFGFERDLELRVREGVLELTFETELALRGCHSTSVWEARPALDPALWRLEPQATVVLPAGAECGPQQREATLGTVQLSADLLEITTRNSPWCRGFDARFVYRRTPPERLDGRTLVIRYAAHFNRRAASAVSELFVDRGSLVEPFTETDDGNYARHEGRERVRRWYDDAFASTPWLALRLLSIERGSAPGHFVAEWEYMDAHLSEPLRGRNLFVTAGGEIYETEIQLVSDPKARTGAAATEAAAAQVTSP